ncbi:MAG: 5-formyltetrahydrofolate cyclo-ligase [Gammaproteobacteria bacterium]|nr:MAG: 5-formyltetrahydrofolate cyclo-ligase [Gammaproteobacteria bacterium]
MADALSLRSTIRAQRQALTPREQQRCAQAMTEHFAHHPLFADAQHIAFYLAANGEANPNGLMQQALTCNKACYLPRLEARSMHFHRYQTGDALITNNFGIDEPSRNSPFLNASELDLVLVPLVAFDDHGNRLGMGGGFYDRTFAFRLESTARPLLVGVAYGFQQVAALARQPWDVPLDGVLTEAGYRDFSR